ncbi:ESSS subunit of NADH:ubiquinone oxidoreductase, partial [Phakopsora pachyrhizi]
DEPSGWLFRERPLKEGQKRVQEDWEIIWYIGFWGTTLFGILTQVYKPNKLITTWARKEVEENMEKPTYEKS